MEWRWNGMGKVLERINGARIITSVFYEDTPHEDGGIGYIDFIDNRFDKPRHRFAFISIKDFEQEYIDEILVKKIKVSQVCTIKVILNEALMNDNKVDIVIERRQTSEKQQHDFLIKVDSIEAFRG